MEAAKKTSPKKAAPKKAKTAASHPTYQDMIARAIRELKERKGSSRQAIAKYIKSHWSVGTNSTAINARLKQALIRGVKAKKFSQLKGESCVSIFPCVWRTFLQFIIHQLIMVVVLMIYYSEVFLQVFNSHIDSRK